MAGVKRDALIMLVGVKSLWIFVVLTYDASSGFCQACNYAYNRLIRIDHTKVSGGTDLTNFPVMVSTAGLGDESVFKSIFYGGHVQNNAGYDVVFTAADGITPLNFQLDSYTASSGLYIAWVNIPLLSHTTDTYIYVYYGNASIISDQSSTATWDANFISVYHFNNDNDGTANGLNGTNHATTISSSGKIAAAVNSFNYIDITPLNAKYNITQNITVSAWVNIGSTGLDQKIAGDQDNSTGGWKMGVYTDNTLEFEIRSSANASTLNRGVAGGTILSSGTWYYVTGQYSQANGFIQTYINGLVERNIATASIAGTTTGTMKIGCEPFTPSTDNWSGTIDELHVSNSIRSAGWIATEYNNQNNPSTFALITPEPATWLGTTSTSWTTATNWSSGLVPATGANVLIANSASNQPTININTQLGSIAIESGAILTLDAGISLSISNDIINCGTLIANATSTLVLNSNATTTPQNQNISGSGAYSLSNLTINNTFATAPSVKLNTPVSVSGALTLTSGVLYTTMTNLLTLTNGSTTSGVSNISYIDGPIKKVGNTVFTFPVGTSYNYQPITIGAPANITDAFIAQYFHSNVYATSSYTTNTWDATIDHLSECEYWILQRSAGTSSVSVTIGWNSNSCGVNSLAQLTVAKYDATLNAWKDVGNVATSGNTTSGTITSKVVNSFSPFTLASTSSASNPLPVELSGFTAIRNNKKVDIKWETVTETNNAYFTIDKSNDGTNFVKLTDITGAGNSTSIKDYYESDYKPYSGTSYYRLKQTDKNGNCTYISMAFVDFADRQNILVYPNLINTNTNSLTVEMNGYKHQEVIVVLRDIQGREIISKLVLAEENNQVIIIDEVNALIPGIYIITASSNDKIYNYKLIVK